MFDSIYGVICLLVLDAAIAFVPVNPGMAFGLRPSSTDNMRLHPHHGNNVLMLHPTLTSATYLESNGGLKPEKNTKRLAQLSNFQRLKADLLRLNSQQRQQPLAGLVDNNNSVAADNLAVETAPYARLPQSYLSILPASYYATHTFVPPIRNLYSKTRGSVKTATKEEELEDWQMKLERERSRTSDNGNLPAATPLIDVDNVSAVLANDIADQQGEIISLDKASEEALPIPQRLRSDYEELEEALPESSFENLVEQTILINEPPSSAGLRDPLEGAVAEFDFKPSNVGPHPILPSYAPYGRPLSSDSSFGVSVTPITVDSNGIKREVASNEVYIKPRVKISKPPIGPYKYKPQIQVPYRSSWGYKGKDRTPASESRKKYYVSQEQESTYLDQLALEGFERQSFDQLPRPSGGQGPPSSNSLFYLAPSGPKMPVFSKLTKDISEMVTGIMRGPVREMTQNLAHSDTPVMARVGTALHKMMGGHMGDRNFDVFDWVPLVALLVATGLILSGLFPTGLTTLGLTNGNLVLGRRMDRAEDESVIEQALGQLESGVMMVSALRHEDGCSMRLACRLGKLAKESDFLMGETGEAIFGVVKAVLPDKFTSFARSFKAVASEEDESSCQQECFRCISI